MEETVYCGGIGLSIIAIGICSENERWVYGDNKISATRLPRES
jgi:hypothetical protein